MTDSDATDAEPRWQLDLGRLALGVTALTAPMCNTMAEAAAVCLEEQGHGVSVILTVKGIEDGKAIVSRPEVTPGMRRTYGEREEATELGACALAFLLIRELTPHCVIERSRRGTGFDYWLGQPDAEPFQHKARLEVSGIRAGDEQAIGRRVKEKLAQTRPTDGTFPAYVAVTEFSRPETRLVQK